MRYFTVFVRQRKYDGGDIKVSEAKSYDGSVQTPNNYRDIKAYGERINDKKKIILKNRLVLKRDCKGNVYSTINDGDLAYIDTKPFAEKNIGENADYVVESVTIGNIYCEIICDKIIK